MTKNDTKSDCTEHNLIIECEECGEPMTLHGEFDTKMASLEGGTCMKCERTLDSDSEQ